MAASFNTSWHPAPTSGECSSLPPDLLQPTQARRLRNFLVHHPGRIVPRGNIGGAQFSVPSGTIDRADFGQILSLGVADDLIVASYRAPTAVAKVDPWRAPINRATSAGDMATGSDDGGALDVRTGTFTPILGVAQLSIQGPSICRVDQALYTATFGGTATLVNGYYDTLNAVRKVAIGGSGVVLTNGPRFVRAVFSHYGRVFAAGARRPGGSDYDPSQIFYTIPGGSTVLTDVATDWQDPVTGELNRVAVGAANDGDFVVGFGRAAGHLLIFKRNSIWILYGTSPANFTLRQLRTQSGCVDFRSIVVADEGTYFASQLGYELFDGNSFRLLSEPVSDVWLPLSNAGVAGGTVTHAFIKADALPNGYIYVAHGVDSHVSGAVDGTTRGWLLHRPSGAWVDLTTASAGLGFASAGYIHRFVQTSTAVTAWSSVGGWARCDYLTYGHDTTNGLSDLGAASVDLLWQSRLDNLGAGRWETRAMHLATVDCAQHYMNDTPAALAAWGSFAAEDGYGVAVVPSTSLEGYKLTAAPVRTRQILDAVKQEVNRGDLSFTVASNIGASSSLRHGKFEIYGVGLAYQGRAGERHIA